MPRPASLPLDVPSQSTLPLRLTACSMQHTLWPTSLEWTIDPNANARQKKTTDQTCASLCICRTCLVSSGPPCSKRSTDLPSTNSMMGPPMLPRNLAPANEPPSRWVRLLFRSQQS
eukprot:15481524-Alexandrium_andersonii.AAC.1